MKRFRFLFLAGCLCLAVFVPHASWLVAADVSPAAYPLWDGHETVAHYAQRVNAQLWGDPPGRPAIQRIALQETQTLDLGNGVTLELVLIPAGKFSMGTPEPQPVDEESFHQKIVTGQAVLAAGGGILLVLLGFSILRAIREKRRFQYSLRRFMGIIFALSLCVLGGMHWWHSRRSLELARTEYAAALNRYKEAGAAEKPAHEVTITQPFYMGQYTVTQEQYQQVMGTNPSHFRGAKLPVETVSWDDAQEFCRKVNAVQQSSGLLQPQSGGLRHTVRLPTEAEWEYACRAGTSTRFYSGDADSDLGAVAWYGANSKNTTHPVGLKKPNAWGLYDMHGNVWQWCQDWFVGYSIQSPKIDPRGPTEGVYRVLRGGSWLYYPQGCRAANRSWIVPGLRNGHGGFRVVVVARTP